MGWALLIFLLVIVAYAFVRGMVSTLEIATGHLRKTMYIVALAIGAIAFTLVQGRLNNDPLIKTNVEFGPGQDGTVQLNGSDHSHDG